LASQNCNSFTTDVKDEVFLYRSEVDSDVGMTARRKT